MKSYAFIILGIVTVLTMNACQRDDDEPVRVSKSISRLYVSTSEYQANSAGADFFNVWALDGVNEDEFPNSNPIYRFTSPAKGGRMIHYSPFSNGILFQGSMNSRDYIDTAVYAMDISKTGVISPKSSLKTRAFDKVRGLFYTVANDGQVSEDFLMIVNASDTTLGDAKNGTITPNYNLFSVSRPRNAGNYTKARYRLKLDFNPWGVVGMGNDILISKADSDGGVVVYKEFIPRLLDNGDSTMKTPENYLLTIAGTQNIRGIAYSKTDDVLMVTDFVANQDNSGRVLVFDKFSQYKAKGTITPSRIISGPTTMLQQPVDIAIDGKEDAKYFFVADPKAKRVFRFLKTDEGNVKPQELSLEDKSPQSISLDSR